MTNEWPADEVVEIVHGGVIVNVDTCKGGRRAIVSRGDCLDVVLPSCHTHSCSSTPPSPTLPRKVIRYGYPDCTHPDQFKALNFALTSDSTMETTRHGVPCVQQMISTLSLNLMQRFF